MMTGCPLCQSVRTKPILFGAATSGYRHCLACDLRFLQSEFFLSAEKERERYRSHQNDLDDPRYRKFLTPLFEAVIKELYASSLKGLDFGAGPGPLLCQMFEDVGHQMEIYDPLFFPDQAVLEKKYNFVSCTEVVEHFQNPRKDFQLLRDLLEEGGVLGIMTHLYSEAQDFESWYYRKDPTHVSFYSATTMNWIRQEFGFQEIQVLSDRVILLKVPGSFSCPKRVI